VCTLEQWCNELAAIPLQHHPGDDWLYGYGHDVIGRIIEVGQPIRLSAVGLENWSFHVIS
jgi:hypothetical protein